MTKDIKHYQVGLSQHGNTFRIDEAFELRQINQHMKTWKRSDSRKLARKLNRGDLVIK